MWSERWTKADVDQWLDSRGLSGQLRAEALGIGEFVVLAHGLGERFGLLPHGPSGAVEKPHYEGGDYGQ
jgi:hypothetical protein